MCGIAGIVNLNNENSYQADHLFKMTQNLHHRGPDDEGFYLFNGKADHILSGPDTVNEDDPFLGYIPKIENNIQKESQLPSKVAFGHRRLSIIDLSTAGHQPMCDQDKRYWLIFNGEIYNYKEIKSELEKRGVRFRSDCDSEVLLYSFIQWGENCLEKFNGMFAFAIFDKIENNVFIARDRIGIKPLFYTIQNKQMIFASDVKSIIASGLYDAAVDWEGLWHNLSLIIAPKPQTTFKDVRSVPAGHWMKINLNDSKIRLEQYYDIPVNVQDHKMTDSQAKELIEAELTKAIKYQLVSDVEVGTFMSGGIDSTTVSAISNKLQPGIKAFTLGFTDLPKYDEVQQAKETAAMHNMEHLIKKVTAEDVFSDIGAQVLGYEEPSFALAPEYILLKFVHDQNIKVILNGFGGDELFAGYPVFKYYPLYKKINNFKFLNKLIPSGINPKYDLIKKISGAENLTDYYLGFYSFMYEYEKRALFNEKYSFSTLKKFREAYNIPEKEFTDDIEELGYYSLKYYLSDHLLYRNDQFSMKFSIEGRYPLLDHNFINATQTIPSKYKLKGTNTKYIFKEVAKDHISPSCISMRKKGFRLPVDEWMDKELKDLVTQSIIDLKKRDVFNNHFIDQLTTKYSSKYKMKVWQLVMLELWFKKFID